MSQRAMDAPFPGSSELSLKNSVFSICSSLQPTMNRVELMEPVASFINLITSRDAGAFPFLTRSVSNPSLALRAEFDERVDSMKDKIEELEEQLEGVKSHMDPLTSLLTNCQS